jgi:Kef-type K+ transport system membrane component KefB
LNNFIHSLGVLILLQETFDESALLIFILEIGAVIIFSLIVAKVLAKRGIPQVLGLIFGGIALQSLTISTGFPSPPTSELHYVITTGALGFIGYSIGAHLDLWKLREASWGLALILFGEALGSFFVVTIIVYFLLQNFILALLLGSISMATAPASTSEVIREYRAYGSLSQTILFIIAFDDILAIIFFNIALGYAESALSAAALSLVDILFPIIIEVVGSIILGILLALFMKPFHIEGLEAYQSAEFVFPSVLICIAIAGLLHFSVILSCIIFGLALSNLAKCENKSCVRGVERLSGPILALFFILVGFEMDLALLLTPVLFTILLYFFARAVGKSVGAVITSHFSKMPDKVTRYLPFSLLTQAGVALGLAAFAYSRLLELNIQAATDIAILILDITAVSVLLAEIFGPLILKKALVKAGEIKEPSKQELPSL